MDLNFEYFDSTSKCTCLFHWIIQECEKEWKILCDIPNFRGNFSSLNGTPKDLVKCFLASHFIKTISYSGEKQIYIRLVLRVVNSHSFLKQRVLRTSSGFQGIHFHFRFANLVYPFFLQCSLRLLSPTGRLIFDQWYCNLCHVAIILNMSNVHTNVHVLLAG